MLYPHPITANGPGLLFHQANTNALLADTLASAAPEAVAGHQILERFISDSAALPDQVDAYGVDDLTGHLLSGKPLPKDLLGKITERVSQEAAIGRCRGILREAHAALAQARDTHLRRAEPALCQHLSTLLNDVISRYQAAVRSEGTPREMEARRADLADQYLLVRQAHTMIVGRLWDVQPHELGELAVMKHPDKVWQWWSAWRRHRHLVNRRGGKKPLNPPWPQLDAPAMLGWLADHPAVAPWIPTRADWATANEQVQQTLIQDSTARPAGVVEPDDNGYLDPSYFTPRGSVPVDLRALTYR